jgi:hypothetical protein
MFMTLVLIIFGMEFSKRNIKFLFFVTNITKVKSGLRSKL